MKKINALILLTLLVTEIFFISCNKNRNCRYDNMTYNKQSKQCECVQAYSPEEILALSSTEYNSCSNYNGGSFFVESPVWQMENVDITQKCYVKSILSFGPQSAKIPWVNVSEPGTCLSADLLFNVIDVHN